MKQYMATMSHGSTIAINWGLVEIDDKGFVNDGVNVDMPIEDYGMFMVRDKPFRNDPRWIFRMFLKLIAKRDSQ